tara:strand:+ start:806 stop:1843 length:1038 start_codon:yes stop_codon:yes gene_type:complete
MSKVVKKVGKAIGKVVKGVVKGVKKVVKKISKSKFFRVIATAALVYFGGAALMGGFSTIGTSTSFLQGMSTGLSNAWAGITGATSSVFGAGGPNFAQAGSQLAAGAKGAAINPTTGAVTSAAGTNIGVAKSFAPAVSNTTNVAPAVANASGANVNAMNLNAGPLNTGSSLPGQTNFVGQAAQSGANVNAALGQAGMAPVPSTLGQTGTTLGQGAGFTPGVSNATLNQMSINSAQQTLANTAPLAPPPAPSSGGLLKSPYTAPALIMTGGQMLSGYAQGKAQEEMMEQQRLEEEARMLQYGQNVGTYIGMPTYNPYTGKYEYANQSPALTYDEYGNVDIYQSGTGG